MNSNLFFSKILFFIFAVMTIPKNLLSQDILVIDLAKNKPGETITIHGNMKKDYIVINNTLAFRHYSIEINNLTQLIKHPELDLPGGAAEDKDKPCAEAPLRKDLVVFQVNSVG